MHDAGSALDATGLLQVLGVEASARVFVLGSNESRVTIYSQQCRAINLVWALSAERRLDATSRIAVIGGGIAGVTAAAAAAKLAAHGGVTLLEQADELMHIQKGSHTRWVHPHILEWPEDGWDNPDAGLPIMNWHADVADNVVKTLRAEFQRHQRRCGIHVCTGVTGVSVKPVGDDVFLSWDGGLPQRFHSIIVAVGFGVEAGRSYWREDDLQQEKGSCLISGTGDGGLTDVLRFTLNEFHQRELPELLQGEWLDAVKRVIRDHRGPDGRGERTTGLFTRLDAEPLDSALAERAKPQLDRLTLNGTTMFPLDGRAAPLNSFLVSRLLRLGLRYEEGRMRPPEPLPDGRVQVELEQESGNRTRHVFARVVCRHGPKDVPVKSFEYLRPLLDRHIVERLPLATDISRHPRWPGDFLRHPSFSADALLRYRAPMGLHILHDADFQPGVRLATHIFKTFFDDFESPTIGPRIPVTVAPMSPANARRTLTVAIVGENQGHAESASDHIGELGDVLTIVCDPRRHELAGDAADVVDVADLAETDRRRAVVDAIASRLLRDSRTAAASVVVSSAAEDRDWCTAIKRCVDSRGVFAQCEVLIEPRPWREVLPQGDGSCVMVVVLSDAYAREFRGEDDFEMARDWNLPLVVLATAMPGPGMSGIPEWTPVVDGNAGSEEATMVALHGAIALELLRVRHLMERVSALVAGLDDLETLRALVRRPEATIPSRDHSQDYRQTTLWVYGDPPTGFTKQRHLMAASGGLWAERNLRFATPIGIIGS